MVPAPVTIVEITKDTPQFEKYFDEMVQVIGQGFSTDPMTVPALGISYEVNPELRHEFDRLQLRAALTGSGRVFAAFLDTDGTERIVGAAIWYGPGRGFLDDDEHASYWATFMGTLSQDTQTWWQDVMLPRYNQLIKEGLGDGVKKDSLHLQILAVLPEWHQKGIGRRLVGHTLGQSEFRGVASCLETSKEINLLFYGSLGYEVKSKILMPSPHGDFTMWCLYRTRAYHPSEIDRYWLLCAPHRDTL